MHILALFLIAGFLHSVRMDIRKRKAEQWRLACYRRALKAR